MAVDPFSTAVPLWGQTTCNMSGLSANRDCTPKKGSSVENKRRTSVQKNKGKILLLIGIGNRYDNMLQFVVVEMFRRCGSYSLDEHGKIDDSQ